MSYQNTSYTELLTSFPPRTIKSQKDLEKTQVVVDKLLDKGQLSEAEEDYLDLLGILIHEYEQQQDLVSDIYGVDLLKALIAELNIKQKDLVPIFKTESIVSDVINGKRKLTVEHIQKLGDFFKVSPAVFLPKNPLNRDLLEAA